MLKTTRTSQEINSNGGTASDKLSNFILQQKYYLLSLLDISDNVKREETFWTFHSVTITINSNAIDSFLRQSLTNHPVIKHVSVSYLCYLMYHGWEYRWLSK